MSEIPVPFEESSSSSDKLLLQIDKVCTQFESNWSADSAIDQIAALIGEFHSDTERECLLRELVATDCELRSQRGLELLSDRFIEEFPASAATVRSAVQMWKETEVASRERSSPNCVLPESIGGYEIVREIGRGGGSVVYEAMQPDLQRRVALKTYTLNPARFHEQRQRFELEARTASRLEHENIVSVYGSGEDSGVLFYVMQFVDGVSLMELIRTNADSATASIAHSTSTVSGRTLAAGKETANSDDAPDDSELPGSSASPGTSARPLVRNEPSDTQFESPSHRRSARMIAQAATALEFAHQRGVLHRDVKPSNLLLDQAGNIRLTDFGLARVRGADNDLTDTGNIVGSLRYLPPEAFDGIRDERGDVYGLGLTLFELLTGQPAFGEKDRAELIRSICEYNVRSPRQVVGSVPPDLDTITMKAIARDPADRYLSARALGDDLQRYLAGKPIHARPVSSVERAWKWCRRHPSAAWLAAVLLLGIPAYLLMWQGRELDRLRANSEIAEAALREEQAANAALEASTRAERAKARAAGAAEARADAEYALLINNAQRAIEAGEYASAVEKLYRYEADLQYKMDAGETVKDRRGWEWDYLLGLLDESSVTIPPNENTLSAVRLSPNESCFVTVGQGWNIGTDSRVRGTVRLRDSLSGELIRTFADGNEVFCDAAFSPSGLHLATISLHDSTRSLTGWVRVWDVASGELLRSRRLTDDFPMQLLARSGPIKKFLPQIQYGPDGKFLVTSAPVIVFDAQTLKPKWQQEDGNRSFVVSHGVLTRKGRLELHDLDTGAEKAKDRGNFALDLAEHPSRSELLHVAGGGNQIAFYRISADSLTQSRRIAIPNSYWTAFTPDGKYVVRSELGGDIVIQEPVENGNEANRLVGHQSPVLSGAFNRSGERLITGDRSGVVKIWDVRSSRNRVTFDVPDTRGESMESIAFDSNNRLHYSSSNYYETHRVKSAGRLRSDGTDHVGFEVETTRHIFWPRHDMAYSPDGSKLAAPAKEGQRPTNQQDLVGCSSTTRIHLWSTDSYELKQTIELDRPGCIIAIAWRKDAKMLAVSTVSSSNDPSVVAFVSLDNASDPTIRWRSAELGFATGLAFTPDGQQLAAAFEGGRVALIPTSGNGEIQILEDIGKPEFLTSCVDVDSTGSRLAVATLGDPGIRIYDLGSQKLVHDVGLNGNVSSVQFSPDGQRLAVANQQSMVYLISAISGHLLLTLDGRSDRRLPSPGTSIKAVFSADGRRIAAPGLHGRLTIWNTGER